MNIYKEIRSLVECKQLIHKYLGYPSKTNSSGEWYISPFRREKTPSLCVSHKGIHDFGDSEHYDIISFTSKYYKCTNEEALKIIARDFHLDYLFNNQYNNEKILDMYKKRADEERRARQLVNEWYSHEISSVCDKIHENNKLLGIFEKTAYFETLSILYLNDFKLNLYFEELNEVRNEEDKVKLYLKCNK